MESVCNDWCYQTFFCMTSNQWQFCCFFSVQVYTGLIKRLCLAKYKITAKLLIGHHAFYENMNFVQMLSIVFCKVYVYHLPYISVILI